MQSHLEAVDTELSVYDHPKLNFNVAINFEPSKYWTLPNIFTKDANLSAELPIAIYS